MNTRAPAIEARQLIKTYGGQVTALNGIDLVVERGSVFGLLGPNGAGKSTTVKILTTLARPDSGSATVAGHDVLRHPDRVRRAIGVVAQGSGADPVATGRENLRLQGRLYGLKGAALDQRVDELLDRFALTEAARRPVKGYSGGMRRRLDVALGLVHRPEVLFLDEPTTGLDPEARSSMWDEIGPARGGGGADDPAHHALPRRGRPARRARRCRRPRPDRRRGHPGRAQGRTPRRRRACGAARAARRRGAHPADRRPARRAGRARGAGRRRPRQRPRRRRGRRRTRPPRRSGAGRGQGRHRDRRPPVPRRRLPALRGPPLLRRRRPGGCPM
ncbi:LOW QUALITY PROTEIN: nodulation ABC transporter NodI, partial [Streptomyces sviceus ATCC 29083]